MAPARTEDEVIRLRRLRRKRLREQAVWIAVAALLGLGLLLALYYLTEIW